MTDLVIDNTIVVTCDGAGTIIDKGGVAVADGRIEKVGGSAEIGRAHV